MFPVLLVFAAAARCVDGIGDRLDQARDPGAELRGQHAERAAPAVGGQVAGVVFDRVVEQRRAGDAGVTDVVVADDPQRDPERMVNIRFALALVSFVKLRGKLQRSAGLLPVGRAVKSRGLELEPGPQSPSP